MVGELNQNYDKIIIIYSKEKENIKKEIDELYKSEYESLSLIKTKISQLVLTYNDFLKKYKDKFSKLGILLVYLSFKMNEFYYEEKVFEKSLQDLANNKITIR